MASTAPVPVSPTRDEDEGSVAQLFNFDACVWFLLGNSGTRRRRKKSTRGTGRYLRSTPAARSLFGDADRGLCGVPAPGSTAGRKARQAGRQLMVADAS
jgi:hypothetical protein